MELNLGLWDLMEDDIVDYNKVLGFFLEVIFVKKWFIKMELYVWECVK